MAHFHEYDVVRVTQLIQLDRHYDGNEGVKRSPRVGDRGTIVHIPPGINSRCIVECLDKDGFTIWLADFVIDELELVVAAK
ncbi:MAG TPA: hypothetical protein VIJ25_01080 [Methylococcales bacterium]